MICRVGVQFYALFTQAILAKFSNFTANMPFHGVFAVTFARKKGLSYPIHLGEKEIRKGIHMV